MMKLDNVRVTLPEGVTLWFGDWVLTGPAVYVQVDDEETSDE